MAVQKNNEIRRAVVRQLEPPPPCRRSRANRCETARPALAAHLLLTPVAAGAGSYEEYADTNIRCLESGLEDTIYTADVRPRRLNAHFAVRTLCGRVPCCFTPHLHRQLAECKTKCDAKADCIGFTTNKAKSRRTKSLSEALARFVCTRCVEVRVICLHLCPPTGATIRPSQGLKSAPRTSK